MAFGQKTRERLFTGLLLGALSLASMPAGAVDYFLAVKQFSMTMPGVVGGVSVPMWGYVLDPEGTCYNTTPNSARLTCINNLPAPTVPGPRLTVAPNEGGNALRIFLSNGLPVPTSIVIPGQEMPFSTVASNGPTWNDSSFGPRPSVGARVRSFGREAAANGGRQQYIWNNNRSNPFQLGTFAYHSGTHPQVQVQMGLYGAVSRDAAAGQAYAGVSYDTAHDLFYSEVDPALHQAVADGTYGTSGPTSTLNYQPKYFLLHSYDGAGLPVDVSIDSQNKTCINGGLAIGNRVLLRMYNAGLRELAPMMIGSHFDLVAEGGRKAPFAQRQYQVMLMPGSTRDAIFTPTEDGTFPLIERRLNLTDNMTMNGGMQTCFTVAAVGNTPPTANAGGPYTGTAGIAITSFNAGTSTDCSPTPCTAEGDSLSYSWNFGDGGSGSGVTPTHTYAAAGTFNVTVAVNDGVNPPVTSPVVTATVAANAPPTANAGGPYSGRTGFPIVMSGSGVDPEGRPLTFSWNFGDGTTGSGAVQSKTYAAPSPIPPGFYAVTLTVNDGVNPPVAAMTTATVINNIAPVANPGGPYNSTTTTVMFSGTGSDGNGDGLTFAWNFGDGTTGTGASPSHTYVMGSGTTFTVTLVVNDGYVNSSPASTTVNITGSPGNAAPVAVNDAFNPDGVNTAYSVAAPGVLANDTDADGNPLTAQLVAGNQNLAGFVLNPNGSFSFGPTDKVGTFPFTYRAFDGTNVSNTATVNVTREIRVTKAEFQNDANATKRRWTVSGKSSRPNGSVVTIYVGGLGGTPLGTAMVSGGNWTFTQTGGTSPGIGFVISVDDLDSTGGAVTSVPGNCKKC